jgi:hypothetical protein
MSTRDLLAEFLGEDCDATLAMEILAEIAKFSPTKADVLRQYTMNRFNLFLDFQRDHVRIEDDLDPSDEGTLILSIDAFAAAMKNHHFSR